MVPVQSPVRSWLRLEALAISAAGLLVWVGMGGGWWRFLLLVLLPDLSMLGYLWGPRTGAALYNSAHSSAFPVLLGIAGGALDHRGLLLAAALWLTHIGVDRLLGFGLKYPSSFQDTHLGRIGGQPMPQALQRTGEHLIQMLNQPDGANRTPVRYPSDGAAAQTTFIQ